MEDNNSLSPFPLVEIKIETPDETFSQESNDDFVNVKTEDDDDNVDDKDDGDNSNDTIIEEEEIWSGNVRCTKEEILEEIKKEDSDESDGEEASQGQELKDSNFGVISAMKGEKKRSHVCDVCVGECKGKCKRLRSIFACDTKPGPSGFGLNNSKPSFFVQTMAASNNLPDILQHDPDTFDDNAIEDCSPRVSRSASNSPPNSPSNRKRISGNDINKSFVEYFQAKRAKIAAAQEQNNEDGRVDAAEHFLLSLLPELEAMTARQIKTFKRKTFRIIDDIMKHSHSTLTHAISPTSFHSSSSHLASEDTVPLDFVTCLPSEG